MVVLSSLIGSSIANVLSNPFWLIKTRVQAEIFRIAKMEDEWISNHYKKTYRNFNHSIWYISHTEGVGALWKGTLASMLGISHVIIYFPLYEKLKEIRKR